MQSDDDTRRLRVKICGLTAAEAVRAVVDHGASMTGFVFFEPSPRHLTYEKAAELIALVPSGVDRVALTVDADDERIDAIADRFDVDWFQLQGSETPARCIEIGRRTGRKVMKAIALEIESDLERVRAYEEAGAVDCLLFDAKPPPDSDIPGGNGLPFDWPLARAYSGTLPWMLSGGLTVDNLEQAVRLSGAAAVDLSSGVEAERGVKDLAKIAAFLDAASRLTGAAEIGA